MGRTKEAVIEDRAAGNTIDTPNTPEAKTAAERRQAMLDAIQLLGVAFDLDRPKIVARDASSDDVAEQVNIVRKYQRWCINQVMRMFDQAIPMVKADFKQQSRRTQSLQFGRSRGASDEFAINQSLDWEDRHEEILVTLKSLQRAADEGYEVVFGEPYGTPAEEVTAVVPEVEASLSDATKARLAARKRR